MAATPAAPRPVPEWSIRVTAHKVGTYPERGGMHAWLRQPGDRFLLRTPECFAPQWMVKDGEKVDEEFSDPVVIEGTPLTTLPATVNDPMSAMRQG